MRDDARLAGETEQTDVEIERPYWPFTRLVCWLRNHKWRLETDLDHPERYCKRCGLLDFWNRPADPGHDSPGEISRFKERVGKWMNKKTSVTSPPPDGDPSPDTVEHYERNPSGFGSAVTFCEDCYNWDLCEYHQKIHDRRYGDSEGEK